MPILRPRRTLRSHTRRHRRSLRLYVPTNIPHRRSISRGTLTAREYSATAVVAMDWSRMLSRAYGCSLLTLFSVSTEKETPYATHTIIGNPTPDYSAPQVVPSQQAYPFGAQPFSPSSHGGSTLGSPQPRPYTFKEHVDTYDQHTSRPDSVPPPVPPKDDRKCGLKKRTFWMLMGCVIFWLIALAVGLGAGLGIGLSKKHK